MSLRRLAERYLELYRTGDLSIVDEIFAPEYVDHTLPQFSKPEGVALAVRLLHAGFRDIEVQVQHVVIEGDRAAFMFAIQGTHVGTFAGHAPTQARVQWTGANFVRVENDRIAELWTVQDNALLRGLTR
ncbi:MAG: ester cyclase [Polyangiales bacterium]